MPPEPGEGMPFHLAGHRHEHHAAPGQIVAALAESLPDFAKRRGGRMRLHGAGPDADLPKELDPVAERRQGEMDQPLVELRVAGSRGEVEGDLGAGCELDASLEHEERAVMPLPRRGGVERPPVEPRQGQRKPVAEVCAELLGCHGASPVGTGTSVMDPKEIASPCGSTTRGSSRRTCCLGPARSRYDATVNNRPRRRGPEARHRLDDGRSVLAIVKTSSCLTMKDTEIDPGDEEDSRLIAVARSRDPADVPLLLSFVRRDVGLEAKIAIDALGHFGPAGADAAVPLAKLLSALMAERRWGLAALVAKALGRIGSPESRGEGGAASHAKGEGTFLWAKS